MSLQPSTVATLSRLYRLGVRHRLAFVIMLFGMVLLGLLNMGLTYLMLPLLEALGPSMAGAAALDAMTPAEVTTLKDDMYFLALIAALAVVPAGFIAGGTWWVSQWLANRCLQDLRLIFFERYLRLDMGFHSRASKGDMITRMSSDMEATAGLMQVLYGKLQQRPVEVLAMIATLFYIDWRLALVVFGVLTPVLGVLMRLFGKTRKRATRARTANANNLTAFEQAATGIRVIKSTGNIDEELRRYDGNTATLFKNEMRTVKTRAMADTVSYGLVFLLPAVIMLVGVWMLESRSITPAVLIVFAGAIGRLTTLVRTTQRAWDGILTKLPAAERIFSIIDETSAIVDLPQAPQAPAPQAAIELQQVRFRYAPDSEEVLRGIDLHIPVGKTVALVGESGGGKSTLLDLLPRFYDVTDGSIRFDGVDVRQYHQVSLAGLFAIVQQDSFLFNATVYENILYGRLDASEAEVHAAARRAHVHDAILNLEGGRGYQTMVGDRGERLSGGQRQRVAIARALLRDAPVLLLDEPTSALDADSERHVQVALEELMQGRTCVVVAHRLATVQHADLIVVLDQGRLVEQGTHAELLAAGGRYAGLVRQQTLIGT